MLEPLGAPQSLWDAGKKPKEKEAPRHRLTQRSEVEPNPREGRGQGMELKNCQRGGNHSNKRNQGERAGKAWQSN